MTYVIKAHGDWVPYTPDESLSPASSSFPQGTIFCKRVSDNTDWYIYSRNPNSFKEETVKLCCYLNESIHIVQVATFEVQRLFPQSMTVIELEGYTGTDPHSDFGQMIYDAKNGTFSAQPPAIVRKTLSKAELWRRCTESEVQTIVDGLGKQPLRTQRIFADAQYLDYDDENFADLKAGFVAAFGAERAEILLAPSS